jgi:Ferritin-like
MSSPNNSTKITTIDILHEYLRHAMMIEHATIPPYLLALYSIRPGTNPEAANALRVVAVEEMLHLTLAANILNAVGGRPDLTDSGFVPSYPANVPTGETDFQVHLQPFSKDAIHTFLNIERSAQAPSEEERFVPRPRGAPTLLAVPGEVDIHFYSIGEFYEEIERGLDYLHEKEGDKLFSGDRARQVTSEYYYSAGGKLFPVTDIKSAVAAANLIIEQGEGLRGAIYDDDQPYELAHLYQFEELQLGRHYQPGDKPHEPTGPAFEVQWDAVYRFKTDAKLSDYPESSELYAAAKDFNQSYADFLRLLTTAFNGEPQLLRQAVPQMFTLRNTINQLIHTPIFGSDGLNAAPTFEMPSVAATVTS